MKLAKREKLYIGAAACILGIFLIMSQLVFPFFDEKEYLERNTKDLEKYIAGLDRIGVQGMDVGKISGNTLKEPLYNFINKEAVAIGLEHELTPSEEKEKDGLIEEKCEVALSTITPSQLIDFLFRIEKPEKNIFIYSISVSHNKKDEGYLDAIIRVMSYKKVNP